MRVPSLHSSYKRPCYVIEVVQSTSSMTEHQMESYIHGASELISGLLDSFVNAGSYYQVEQGNIGSSWSQLPGFQPCLHHLLDSNT